MRDAGQREISQGGTDSGRCVHEDDGIDELRPEGHLLCAARLAKDSPDALT